MSPASYAAQRARFLANSVATASPARLLTMLYDRLVLDLARAEEAQRANQRIAASAQLIHAQEIVLELTSSLVVDAWDGGPGLLNLYTFLHSELVRANISGDADKTAACRAIVEPLRDAWHAAAIELSVNAAVDEPVRVS